MLVPVIGGPLSIMVTSQSAHIYLSSTAEAVLSLLSYCSCVFPFVLESVTWFHYWTLWSPVACRMGLGCELETTLWPSALWGTSLHPVALAVRFFPITHVSQIELTVGWSWETPDYFSHFRGFGCCHAVLMSPFPLLGPCHFWDPWGSRETWAKFYYLSLQAMLLSTVYKSLDFLKSSILSKHWKYGFTSICGWLLSGGDTFCPSDLTVNFPQVVSRHCLEWNAD
jgi:hypothetical protein